MPGLKAAIKTCTLRHMKNRCVYMISEILFCIQSPTNLTDSSIALTRDLRHCSNKRFGMSSLWPVAHRTSRTVSTTWATHSATLSLLPDVSLTSHWSVHFICRWKRGKSGSAIPPRFKCVDRLFEECQFASGGAIENHSGERDRGVFRRLGRVATWSQKI